VSLASTRQGGLNKARVGVSVKMQWCCCCNAAGSADGERLSPIEWIPAGPACWVAQGPQNLAKCGECSTLPRAVTNETSRINSATAQVSGSGRSSSRTPASLRLVTWHK
jgi:hypothetical protein